jgi:hypothetical protein
MDEKKEPFHYGTPQQVARLESEALKHELPTFPLYLRREGRGESGISFVFVDDLAIIARTADDAQRLAEKIAAAINEHSVQTAGIISDGHPAQITGSAPAAH